MKSVNQILQGDCVEVLKSLPDEAIDLVVTDPPYLVNFRDRTGRTVRNDSGNPEFLGAFADLYRVLKRDSFCVCFYGWTHVDQFFSAWRQAGFRPVGHIVWQKDYSSRSGFLHSCHEQVYLLVKGNPGRPAKPLADVQPWEYSGNRAHPTEKAVGILTPVIQAFSKPGDIVLDPFAGSGSTAVAAALSGRRYIGIELEEHYCRHARTRLAGAARYAARKARNMDRSIKQAAILANPSALRATLAGALERAADAENAIKNGHVNQAIGAASGIETMLQDAMALYAAALARHRGGRA